MVPSVVTIDALLRKDTSKGVISNDSVLLMNGIVNEFALLPPILLLSVNVKVSLFSSLSLFCSIVFPELVPFLV